MNRPPRVLLIGRHFWPHGSIDSAMYLYQLSRGLKRTGVQVQVLTPRYASTWPEQFVIDEIRVHRPAAAPRSDWSMGRYTRHLAAWLRSQGPSFDVMMVDAIREEAAVVGDVARSLGCPVVVRCSGWGDHSDTAWWKKGRGARRCGAAGRSSDAVIATSALCQRALISEGYDRSRMHRIEDGFPAGMPRSGKARLAARHALASANGDLATDHSTPVVVCASRLTHDGGVNLLARAARNLIARFPDLRLWFLGDGPHRDWIFEFLRGEGVRASIAMPGSFSDVQEVFAAADLYVQLDEDGLDYFLPTAIASELPVVALDTESTRSIIGGETTSGWVEWIPGGTAKLTRVAVVKALNDLTRRREHAAQLRRALVRSQPRTAAIEAYATLFDRLARGASPVGRDESVEALS